MTKCRTCGGTYAPIDATGVAYFHACPPLSDAELCAALTIPTDDAKRTDKQRAQIAAASRVRPSARNENVPPPAVLEPQLAATTSPLAGHGDDPKNALRQAAIIAAGAGVETIDVQG